MDAFERRRESLQSKTLCEIPQYSSAPDEILEILSSCRSIAIVGISPKPERDSHKVAAYLLGEGYEIVPVNPGQREILGRPCYRSLSDIPFTPDIADLFLNPTRIPPVVDEAIAKGVKVIWMQLGVIHNEAAKKAMDAGIKVVMNRCIMAEHRFLSDRIPRQPSQRA